MAKNIGIVAGGGGIVKTLLKNLKRDNYTIYLVALKGATDKNIEKLADKTTQVHINQLSKTIDFFKNNQVKDIVFLGSVHRPSLFKIIFSDIRSLKILKNAIKTTDDHILRLIIQEFEKEGLTVQPAHKFLPEHLSKEGIYGHCKLTDEEKKDIIIGWQAINALSQIDAGQGVVVYKGSIVALECIEGTDALIERAGNLTHKKGGVLVKRPKINQEMRVDLPTVGIKTLEKMKENGLTALALEANKCFIADINNFFSVAKKYNITVIAISNINSL